MKSIDSGGIKKIRTALDAAISRNPALRKYQQQTRVALSIATALTELSKYSKTKTNDLAIKTALPESEIQALFDATSESEPCAQTIAKLAESMGFRFELQIFPEDRLSEVRRRDENLSGDEMLGGVLIRLPFVKDRDAFESSIENALNRLKSNLELQSSPAYNEDQPRQKSKSVLISDFLHASRKSQFSIAELLSLADAINFKIQLRFAPRNIDESAHPFGILSPTQSAEDTSRAFRSTYTKVFG